MTEGSYYGYTVCPNCGKEIEKLAPNHVFCSETCKMEAFRRGCETVNDLNEVPEEERKLYRQCETCGKWFKPFSQMSTQKYCCFACQYKAKTEYSEKYKREKRRQLSSVPKKVKKASKKQKDYITWDEIRAVLAEEGISSYHEAVKIADQRRRERETLAQLEKGVKA